MFYLTAFYDSCENSIEPIFRGYKLVLVYDLLWSNATNEIPRNLPVFLGALKQIKESLRPWRNQFKLLKSKMEKEKRQNLVEEIRLSLLLKLIKILLNQSNVSRTKQMFFLWRTRYRKMFFFSFYNKVMKRTSSPSYYFKDRIRVFADILLNCDFLDVHLPPWQHNLALKFNREKLM